MFFFKFNIVLFHNVFNSPILSTTKNVYSLHQTIFTNHYMLKNKNLYSIFFENYFKNLFIYYFYFLTYIKNIYFFLYRSKKKYISKKNIFFSNKIQKINTNKKNSYLFFKYWYKKYNKYINDNYLSKDLLYQNRYYYFKHFLYFFFKKKRYSTLKRLKKKMNRKKRRLLFYKIKKKSVFFWKTDFFFISNKWNHYMNKKMFFFQKNIFFSQWFFSNVLKFNNNIFIKKKITTNKKTISFNLKNYIYFFNFFYKKQLLNIYKLNNKKIILKDIDHNNDVFFSYKIIHDKKPNKIFFFDENKRFFFKNIYLYYFFKEFKKKIKTHYYSNLFKIFFSIKKERLTLKKKLNSFLNVNEIGTVTYKNTLRNVFLTLSKKNGNHLYHISSGHLKFFGRKKVYYKTIYNLTRRFLYKLPFFLYKNNIFFIKILITGYLNDMFHFIRPFFKRSYYFDKSRYLFTNYLFFLKKYILYLKFNIISNKNLTLFNYKKYLNILFRCYYLSFFIHRKYKKKQFLNFKLLYIQIKSNKFFAR